MNPKIGLLLPSSECYPALASDFLNGLKLAFGVNQLPIPSIIFEGIGTGTDDSLLRISEKLIIQEEIDIVVGFCGINNLERLTGIFAAHQKAFIHLDFGANIYNQKIKNDFVVRQTFNLWEAMYYAGKYAAQNIGKKINMNVSFYEAGYQLVYSFFRGFIDNGGSIVGNHVAGADYKAHDFGKMLEDVKNTSSDLVLNLFSYKEGEIVYQKMIETGILNEQVFIYNPLMTKTFNETKSETHQLLTISPFYADSENIFFENYPIKYKKAANEIALMGYETGLTIIESMRIDPEFMNPIAQNLKGLTYQTPRGTLTLNTQNELEIDCFTKIETINGETTHKRINLIEENYYLSEPIKNLRIEEMAGGWYNPYQCT